MRFTALVVAEIEEHGEDRPADVAELDAGVIEPREASRVWPFVNTRYTTANPIATTSRPTIFVRLFRPRLRSRCAP